MVAEQTSQLTLALVAGGFASLGVLAKIGFDAVVIGRQSNKEGLERFAEARRAAYDDFLDAVKRQQAYAKALRALLNRARMGETEMSEGEQAAFPPSPMPDLVDALERIHRFARVYDVVSSAEAIVRLFADQAAASRAALEQPSGEDDLVLFLIDRFIEDRVSEFVHAYRHDLGLGVPQGAPKRWPIRDVDRPVPLADSERIVRARIPPKEKP